MEDLRIRILRYYKERNTSTEEHSSNAWLEKQNKDLGTIRRALLELINDDYLIISNASKEISIQKVTEKFETKNLSKPLSDDDILKKSSERLIKDVGDNKKIPEYKFITTVKGIKFLIEFDKLNNDSTMAKWQKIAFWPLLIISSTLAIFQVISFCSENRQKNTENMKMEIQKNDNNIESNEKTIELKNTP